MASEPLVQKRLQISGLVPSITPAHLQDRFASFGTVRAVDSPGPDALGQDRRYAFLEIETSAAQLRKCMNIMSGSTWRGAQLRLAEAKPRWDARLEKERNPPVEEIDRAVQKKRKRREIVNAAEGVGKQAQDMRLVDGQSIKNKKFWHVDEEGHLIRPIAMRPARPLSLPRPAPSSAAAGPSTKKRPSSRPSRAKRRVIDPSKLGATHLSFGETSEVPVLDRSGKHAGEWNFVPVDEDQDEDEDDGTGERETRIVGIWQRSADGRVVEEEVVRGPRRGGTLAEGAIGDEDGISLEEFAGVSDAESDSSDLFAVLRKKDGARREEVKEDSPLFSATPNTPGPTEPSPSPMSDDKPVLAPPSPARELSPAPSSDSGASISVWERMFEKLAAPAAPPPKKATPSAIKPAPTTTPPTVPSAEPAPSAPPLPLSRGSAKRETRSPSSSPGPVVPASTRVELPQEVLKLAGAEKSLSLGVLGKLFGEMEEGGGKRFREKAFVDDDDEEEDEDAHGGKVRHGPLRLRGGGMTEKRKRGDDNAEEEEDDDDEDEESSGSESDESSDDDGSSSESSESSSDENEPVAEDRTLATPGPGAEPKKSSGLKDLFAQPASGTGGFSLFSTLQTDIELDESFDIPLPASSRPGQPSSVTAQQEEAPLELLSVTRTTKTHFDASPDIPLFFATAQSFSEGRPKGKGKDAIVEDRLGEGWREFHAQETDEAMKERWEREKLELTRAWKRRFREGKKQRRRRGGGGEEFD